MSLKVSAVCAIALLGGLATAVPQHVPPKVSGAPRALGHTTDPEFSPAFYSDGGAGGFVNGYNLITLSDARTNATGPYLVHTVYAYFGIITIIGDYKANPHFYLQGPNGCGQGVVASLPSDPIQCTAFGPGPNTAMVQIPGNKTGGINAWTVYNDTAGSGAPLFNTLIEYNVVDPQTLINSNTNIPAVRTIPQFYQAATQPLYGSDGFASDNTNLYLLALDKTGFKLATVNAQQRTSRTAYQYWNNATQKYSNKIPTLNDKTTNLFNPSFPTNYIFGSDLFYSPYFQTWIITYSGSDYYGAKYLVMAYSKTGQVTGPFIEIGSVYKPDIDPGCANVQGSVEVTYLLHAHPGWDTSGKTLLVSWESCNTYTNMAIITWQ